MAVVVRERPELEGKPVAVCHSDSARGTGEISSANYPARAFGQQSDGLKIVCVYFKDIFALVLAIAMSLPSC